MTGTCLNIRIIRRNESGLWRSDEIVVDAVADARRGRLHGIAGKVGVTGGCLYLGVTEQLTDHRQAFAQRQRARGEGVAQVVKGELRRPQALRTMGRSG